MKIRSLLAASGALAASAVVLLEVSGCTSSTPHTVVCTPRHHPAKDCKRRVISGNGVIYLPRVRPAPPEEEPVHENPPEEPVHISVDG